MDATFELPPRSRWIKSRGTIGLALLAPFLACALLTAPHWPVGAWGELLLNHIGWASFSAGVAFRFWSALYIGGRKGQALATEGPYSICRNPLYLGSFLILVGFTTLLQSLTLAAGAALTSLVYLVMTIHDEEHRLAHKFGPAYLAYCRAVPRFVPRPWLLHTPDRVDVNIAGLARECHSAALYVWLPALAWLLEQLRDSGALPQFLHLP